MSEVLFSETTMVPVSQLKPYEKNPRKGDVRAIAESLETNKQYRPIVVQKNSKRILAGNHTWQAAKQLKWDKIAVVYVDVDDEQAARIVLADNRTNDLATYDNQILADVLRSIGDAVGTGYSESDMEALLAVADSTVEDVYTSSHDTQERALIENDRLIDYPTQNYRDRDDIIDVGLDDTVAARGSEDDEFDSGPEDIKAQPGVVPGVFTLKPDLYFPSSNYWGIPDLAPEMMIEELPDDIHTWAGSATRDVEWDGYWLYNWGVDSTSGMKDLSKIILSFYCFDEYFEGWWERPVTHLSKVFTNKIEYAITPNYSQGGLPPALSLHQLYKSRWVGRYLQEIGCRVMPDLEMRDEPQFLEIALSGLPRPLPWASVQVQNINSTMRTGVKETPEFRQQWVRDMKSLLRRAEIQNLLVYGWPDRFDEAAEWFEDTGVNVRFVTSRLWYLSQRARQRRAEGKQLSSRNDL